MNKVKHNLFKSFLETLNTNKNKINKDNKS
jgi:hypothetical protein